jgi:hypothetical protein
MRTDAAATAISWIPSEAITGIVYKLPFAVEVAHYDDPPPDVLPDIDAYLAADGARFANQLRAWVEVDGDRIVDFGHCGKGSIGSTTLRLRRRSLSFMAFALPDLQRAQRLGPGAVRFEQTAGGRTGVPAPRRVAHLPYAQFAAPLAWSTLALTVHADGRQEVELAGASPFPRHWVYDADGKLIKKSAVIDYHRWSTTAFGRHTPWGDVDSPALVGEIESALERRMSLQIMRAGARPQLRRLARGERLTVQHEAGDELYLLLDGLLRVEVDGNPLAELGPGAVLGERAVLEGGRRTATLLATSPCLVAVADPRSIDPAVLRDLAEGHHREDDHDTSGEEGN